MKRLIAFLLCAFTIQPEARTMVDPGQWRGWTLVVAEDALPSERYAADEFQILFEQATGHKLMIQNRPPGPVHNIFIGPSQFMQASSAKVTVADLGDEGLRIRIEKDNVAIAGGRPRGTLYGVYEFMERYLGVRFLTYDHTYFPRRTRWAIPCETWSYNPPFSFRWSYYKENQDHPAFAARLRINTVTPDERLGGNTPQRLINHSLHHLLPVEQYGQDHPEYFALVEGERRLQMGGGGPQICASNPDVVEIVARNVIRELDKDPNQKNYSVSQNDNDAYCRCANCEAINRREGTPMGSLLAFVNAVAERVEQKYPEVKIGTLAYWYSRTPPKTLKPRKNVQIQLCSIECSTLQPLDDSGCARNRAFCADMDAWARICQDIWIWNYNTNFRFYDLPFPNLRVIGPNVRYFVKNHVKGVFMQANGNGNAGEMCDLRNYVMARCLWNPSLDSWELAREFCRLHYGQAGDTIFSYLDYLHDHAERSGFEPNCFPMPFELGITPASARKIYDLFAKALAEAEDRTVRDRVEKASICAYRSVLEVGGKLNLQNGIMRVVYPGRYGDLVGDYLFLTRKHGETRAEEWQPIEHYYQVLAKATKEGYPARLLENPYWHMLVVGEGWGKVIELTYKPADRDLLMPRGFRSLRFLLDYMVISEKGLKGFDSSSMAAFATEKPDFKVVLTNSLSGTSLERQIGFVPGHPTRIQFRITVLNQGNESKTYQWRFHPELHCGQVSTNYQVITSYIRDGGWVPFNKNWRKSDGPGRSRLENARGGSYAFYNHAQHYGAALSYDPALIERPAFWWSDTYPYLYLDLISKPLQLEKSGSLTWECFLEYLDRPPQKRHR